MAARSAQAQNQVGEVLGAAQDIEEKVSDGWEVKIERAIERPQGGHGMYPCPLCHVITVRQPWASLIALGFKHYEFRTRRARHAGQVIIHAGTNWYSPPFRNLVHEHFAELSENAEQAVDALFPTRVPVCDATLIDCVPVQSLTERQQRFGGQVTPEGWGLRLTDARIITRPKPTLNGLLTVPWKMTADRGNLRELASALARARRLAGTEKNNIYRAFKLPSLAAKLNAAL